MLSLLATIRFWQKDEKHITEGALLRSRLYRVSNVTIHMISYLLFPVTGHSVYCFSTAFPDVCKRRETKFSLRVYSEKENTLGAPSCSYRKQTEWLPSPPLELSSDEPLSLVCFCVLQWLNAQRVWEPVRRLKHIFFFQRRQVRIHCCGINSNLAFSDDGLCDLLHLLWFTS